MSKDDGDDVGISYLGITVIIGIIVFLMIALLDSCGFPHRGATIVKDMGFFMIVEYKGEYYIINENDCERGIKLYEQDNIHKGTVTREGDKEIWSISSN